MSVRLITIILLTMASALAAGEPVNVPGTRVTIDPPDGFVLAADFPGFINSKLKSTITVVEVPSSFIELTERYNDESLKREGIDVRERRQIERDGLRAIIVTGVETVGSRRVVKKMMMTGDVAESLIVTAIYRQEDEQRLGDEVDRALQLLLWDSSRLVDHFEGIGFRLKEIPGLRVATRVSNSVIFTRNGTLPDQYYTGQMLIVGWSKDDVSTIENKRAFAEQRFRNVAILTKVKIDNVATLNRDGVDGFEIVGQGTHRYLGYEVAAFQVMLHYRERFLLAQGFADVEDPESAYDQFRTIMGTISTDD